MEYTVSIDIAAPPDRVWTVMSDIERWHEWTASITSIQKLEPGPLAVGLKARVRQPKLPPAVWTVSWVEPHAGFVWVSRAPGVHVTGRHMVEASASGSRATLSIAYEGLLGVLIGRLTRPVNERYLGLEAEGLKKRSEAAP
jgi:carbon monoxide dehydrogenase subunit G